MKKLFLITILISSLTVVVNAKDHKGITSENINTGYFTLINNGVPAMVLCDNNDDIGVNIAAENLRKDFIKVCGNNDKKVKSKNRILVGTLSSSIIKKNLPENLKKELEGKTEKYIIYVPQNNDNKGNNDIIIAGSDKRGTIYGIYEMSEQIGVSPWYDWADVPVKQHKNLSIKAGSYTAGEPAVRYRGIFINDEAPCLTSWVKNTYGTDYGNHQFYARVFELILRLRGNYLWPAMWGWAFYADDAQNSKTANDMGVIMGTSHHEPMARNHQEYARNRQKWGAWNYETNKENLDKFFREGIERAKDTEDLITIGMRGDGDTAMGAREGHDDEADGSQDQHVMNVLKDVIDSQRKIISDVTGKPANERPQIWALYKEVQKYYDMGLRVPDDVTILLSDDNWGNIRSLPNEIERTRKGGWGIYYHVDYVGAPRNTKWLNVTPIANMWEQLQLTYDYGVDKVWILNVGDIKPMEYPISLFLDMAWNPKAYTIENLLDHTYDFFVEQFGESQAKEATRIMNLYSWYNGRVTPEMLDARTYNYESGEWKQVKDEYAQLAKDAQKQYNSLKPEYKDAYKQIILYPVVAMSNLYNMYYAAADGDAKEVERCFKYDQELMDDYNLVMAGGKWNGMMTQNHIGYRSWQEPRHQTMPQVMPRNNKAQTANKDKKDKGYVAFDAEDFVSKNTINGGEWKVIPFMGRTKSGVALMPYTIDPKGASLSYKVDIPADKQEVTVYVITKSSLAFKNKEGHCFTIGFDGAQKETVNINRDLNEDHAYDKLYPTVARRVIENKVTLKTNGQSTLTISPLDPGIVFEKIIVDFGGWQRNYLYN